VTIGTPLYMAPEQIEGGDIDGRTDIYALGAVVYQMVTGRPPFEGADPFAVGYKHVHEPPVAPSEIVAGLPAGWDGVILRALAKSPADRFQSAAEMGAAIENLSVDPQATHEPKSMWRRIPMPLPGKKVPSLSPARIRRERPESPTPGGGPESPVEEASSRVSEPAAMPAGERRLRARRLGAVPLRLIAAALTVLLVAGVVVWRAQPSAKRAFAFGTPDLGYGLPPPNPPKLGAPAGLALDRSGDAYVVDGLNGTVRALSPSGDPLAVFPAPGSGVTLDNPTSVGLDSHGSVYVADTLNNRIVKFSGSGTYEAQWHAQPGGNTAGGNAPQVGALTVDPQDHVYVLNWAADRVEKYTSGGTFLTQWAARIGTPTKPPAITSDAHGNIWVANPTLNRVNEFLPNGQFRGSFSSAQSHLFAFHFRQLTADAAGHIYLGSVLDRAFGPNPGVIQEFTPQGKLLASWENIHAANDPLSTPAGLAVDATGDVYVSDPGHGVVRKLEPAAAGGATLETWDGTRRPGSIMLHRPIGIAVDARGSRVYVSEVPRGRIISLASQGQTDGSWNSAGSQKLSAPWNLALGPRGDVYVADSGNNRIDVFSGAGTFLHSIGRPGAGVAQLHGPTGVAVDGAGDVYVVDEGNLRVVKLSPTGKELATRRFPGQGAGFQSASIGEVAVSRTGTVYLPDEAYRTMYELSSDLKLLTHIGSPGSAPGEFDAPSGAAVGANGDIYVADSGNNRIEAFSADGTFLAQLTGSGAKGGRFSDPNGVAVDGQGNLYVADTGNNRVVKFFAGN
jgi:sugar lactone lactonase YvrE